MSPKFTETIYYLTAFENKLRYEKCWHELAGRALRLAYSSGSLQEINYLLMNSPIVIRRHLVSWFKQLGIMVVAHNEIKGGWCATGIEDKSKQRKMIFKSKTTPLNFSNNDASKRWLDDLELDNRGHSVRALQGGRASGK